MSRGQIRVGKRGARVAAPSRAPRGRLGIILSDVIPMNIAVSCAPR